MDSVTGQNAGPSRNSPMVPTKVYSIQLKRLKVSVWKADLTTFQADAVVNAANERLAHYGGLAQALSDAGGPDIQTDSDRHVKKHGPLRVGEAVVTGAGSLKCRSLIHAVGPRLPPQPSARQVQQAEPLLATAVENVLLTAGRHDLSSVAVPALSSGLFNFPVDTCADVIVDALRRWDEDRSKQGAPRQVHLVNNDDPTVSEMERACVKILGRGAPTPVSQAVRRKQVGGSKPSTVQIEDVRVALTKGRIEEQQTDVIVNTIGDSFCLATGEISKAILKKAGKRMQDEMDRKHRKRFTKKPIALPLVLETDPHGLSCKHVYHTMCARKDDQRAHSILYEAIIECLWLASKKYKSISFPAIGTGNLGFSKDEVSSIMLGAVEDFARRSLKALDVHVVIYPAEDSTFVAFERHMRNIQDKGLVAGLPRGSEEESVAVTPHVRLSGARVEAVQEARRWLENLLSPSGVAVVVTNNFIQYLGERELRRLNGGTKGRALVEESFQNGCASIKVTGESARDVVERALEVEGMLCDVQREFEREVKARMSPRSTVTVSHTTKPADREAEFRKHGLRIRTIDKVENSALKEAFEFKRKALGSSSPPRRMYQRVPAQFRAMVAEIGFQREYAPPADAKYGEGIYFAGSVDSAVELWGRAAATRGDVYWYLVEALVLTGNSTPGKPDLIIPPPVGGDPLVLYDSLTGGRDVAVVFSGHQALPEYVFVCEEISESRF